MEEKEPYIIHQDTMLLKPAFSEYNEPLVDIYETSGQLTIAGRSTNVVKESCRYYGSSLAGRQEGTKAVTGYTRQIPVAISPDWDLYLFPIGSPGNITCVWINYRHLEKVDCDGPKHCILHLSNGERVPLDVNGGRINTQLYRTAHFKSKLSRRLG